MVKLGALTLPEFVKNEQDWGNILAILVKRQFIWEIKDRAIHVRKRRGLWEQLQNANKCYYAPDKLTLEDIKEAIGQLYNQQNK